jgi:BarA-like signal transduction histidine kinase
MMMDQYMKLCIEDPHSMYPILRTISKDCQTIVKIGGELELLWAIFQGWSESSLEKKQVILIDPNPIAELGVKPFLEVGNILGAELFYLPTHSLYPHIPKRDMLYINTLHTYDQLTQELTMHHANTNKYILLDNTYKYALEGETTGDTQEKVEGIAKAVSEFVAKYPVWNYAKVSCQGKGYILLEKI